MVAVHECVTFHVFATTIMTVKIEEGTPERAVPPNWKQAPRRLQKHIHSQPGEEATEDHNSPIKEFDLPHHCF